MRRQPVPGFSTGHRHPRRHPCPPRDQQARSHAGRALRSVISGDGQAPVTGKPHTAGRTTRSLPGTSDSLNVCLDHLDPERELVQQEVGELGLYPADSQRLIPPKSSPAGQNAHAACDDLAWDRPLLLPKREGSDPPTVLAMPGRRSLVSRRPDARRAGHGVSGSNRTPRRRNKDTATDRRRWLGGAPGRRPSSGDSTPWGTS